MAENKYPCTQSELYLVAEQTWNLFLLHIGDFTSFRNNYSIEFYEKRLQELNRAKQIKDKQELLSDVTRARNELTDAVREILHCFKCLAEYTAVDSLSNYQYYFKRTAHYRKASNNNWESANIIATNCAAVLREGGEELVAEGNIPRAFLERCKDAIANMQLCYKKFCIAKNDVHTQSKLKVVFSNGVYKELTTLLRHAQLIYRNKPEMQALFCFDRILKKQRAEKKQPALTGAVKDKLTMLRKVTSMFF